MQRKKTIALGAVLVSGLFPAAALAQSTDTTSDYGPNTTSTQQASPTTPNTTSVEADTQSNQTAPATSGTPAATAAPTATTNQLAYTGNDVWKGLVAGAVLLGLAALVVVPRRRKSSI